MNKLYIVKLNKRYLYAVTFYVEYIFIINTGILKIENPYPQYFRFYKVNEILSKW